MPSAFLIEAQLMGLFGRALGASCACLANGMTLNAAVGAKQVAFAFRINGSIVLSAAPFTVAMALAGGVFPALSATRIKAVQALG